MGFRYPFMTISQIMSKRSEKKRTTIHILMYNFSKMLRMGMVRMAMAAKMLKKLNLPREQTNSSTNHISATTKATANDLLYCLETGSYRKLLSTLVLVRSLSTYPSNSGIFSGPCIPKGRVSNLRSS